MRNSILLRCLPAAGAIFLAACAATNPMPEEEVRDSGFLGELDSSLEPDTMGVAEASWTKPGLDLSRYTKFVIEPAQIWLTPENRAALTDEEIAAMSKYGYDAARASLGRHWEIVDTMGPDTLRIQWALTELAGANAAGSTFTKVIPQTKLLTNAGYLASDKVLFAARVQVEAKLLDENDQPLFAMRGARQGGTSITNAFSTWGEVKDSFDRWAESAPKRAVKLGMKPTKAPVGA